jgi:hypothetical protein
MMSPELQDKLDADTHRRNDGRNRCHHDDQSVDSPHAGDDSRALLLEHRAKDIPHPAASLAREGLSLAGVLKSSLRSGLLRPPWNRQSVLDDSFTRLPVEVLLLDPSIGPLKPGA